jgi:hypothetical protein
MTETVSVLTRGTAVPTNTGSILPMRRVGREQEPLLSAQGSTSQEMAGSLIEQGKCVTRAFGGIMDERKDLPSWIAAKDVEVLSQMGYIQMIDKTIGRYRLMVIVLKCKLTSLIRIFAAMSAFGLDEDSQIHLWN